MNKLSSSQRLATPEQRYSAFLGIALFLGLLLALTWGARTWRVHRVEQAMPAAREAAAAAVLEAAEAQFYELLASMRSQGEALAASPSVVRSLRAQREGVPDAVAPAVRYLAGLDLPPRRAVEVYDGVPQLIAWNGFSMPLDAAVNTPRFMDLVQTAVVRDARRQALALWVPVRDGARVLGAVRVTHLVEARVPVENQYLRDYDVGTYWARQTGGGLEVRFGKAADEAPAAGAISRRLQGFDGTLLGRATAELPPEVRVAVMAAAPFDDVMAFWATLLLGWLVAGLWAWYRVAPARELRRRSLRLAVTLAAWWGLRIALLVLDTPARWQPTWTPLSPLFDPGQLASTLGGGLFRSTGDLLLTSLFAAATAAALVQFTAQSWSDRARWLLQHRATTAASAVQFAAGVAGAVLLIAFLALGLGVAAHRAVLDSTLDYFSRADLLPERLVFVVFSALLLLALAAVLAAVSVWRLAFEQLWRYRPPAWSRVQLGAVAALAALVPLGVLYLGIGMQRFVPWPATLALLGVSGLAALVGAAGRAQSWLERLSLRRILMAIFLLTLLLYPMLYKGMDAQRRLRMVDAADAFDEGRDPRTLFAVEQVLHDVDAEAGEIAALLANGDSLGVQQALLSDQAARLLRGSILGALTSFDVSLTFLDARGQIVGRFAEGEQVLSETALDRIEADKFDVLRRMYAERGRAGMMVEQMTGRRESERFEYEGLLPIRVDTSGVLVGWAMARAEPQTQPQAGFPLPLALVPTGDGADLYASLSVAAFRRGVLVRSMGSDFGRYRLSDEVERGLVTQPDLWRREQVKGRRYLTYYRRTETAPTFAPDLPAPSASVVAVRVPAISPFDHLFYLLRLTVAGLFVGLPLYLGGLYVRWRRGLLPAPRVQFRERVLNAFLAVGIIAVGAVGLVGLGVVTSENERAVRSWLENHLERVDELLALEAQGDEMPYRVLGRMTVDSLAARVGLDLNLYEAQDLVASSRPQLVRDRLLEPRLPAEAYQALYFDGFRFTVAEQSIGGLAYMAGYRALPDEQGEPRYVLSIPTLPEQERIEEERARTLAYLFGSLLVLVLVVMGTAALLAGAIARPIGRLREGLEAVARGQFQGVAPTGTRDEIDELVTSFNRMQGQLSESRRQLAQQERQLAWREMARQVAHEIKNPLTPMKLSVQHLRRAHEALDLSHDGAPDPASQKFDRLFERITSTLVEQIDTLARIANEFSSFARLPTRVLEQVDLNTVIREAADLMQEEAGTEIALRLTPGALVVEADREELRRVYINLIKNAIQAMPDEADRRVTVTTTLHASEEDEARFAYSTVEDQGVGIPEPLRERIFEPNFSTKTSGTGLGLAIVKKAVEDVRGEIGFETEEGAGTTFWVRLPLVEG